MNIAGEAEARGRIEPRADYLKQIDYLGGMPRSTCRSVRQKSEEMLQFDLENEMVTIRNYRNACVSARLGEYAMAEFIREILKDEQDHLIALATALGRRANRPECGERARRKVKRDQERQIS
jgi:bacterioferritin